VKLTDREKEYDREVRGSRGKLTTTKQAVAGETQVLAGSLLRRGDCVVRQEKIGILPFMDSGLR